MSTPNEIILGDGIFSIGSSSTAMTALTLTRGGGSFKIEREFRIIEADGDYGPVKNRIRLIKEVPKLNMKQLEIIPANTEQYFPAMSAAATAASTTSTLTTRSLTTNITSDDYNFVTWAGYTKGGRAVVIQLQNAINLEEINWDVVDKEEVINEMTMTGTYIETARTTAPWKVFFTTTSSSS
jgi:hypothetical protein